MISIKRLVVFLFCCLLIACRIDLSPSAQVNGLQNMPTMALDIKKKQQQKDIFSQGNWPNKHWWRMYHSPQLNALISEALAKNPSLQAVKQRVNVAKQESVIVGSALFPLVFFNATDSAQYTSKNGLYRVFNPTFPLHAYVVDLSLSFTYDFDFWGKNHNLFYAALGKERALRAEAANVKLIVTTALTQAYFAYKTNGLREKLYEQLLFVRIRINELNHLMLHKGLYSALPPLRAEENVEEAKKLVAIIKEERQIDRHLINILVGRGPDTPISIDQPLADLPQKLTIPKTLSLNLLARRPDLMAQIWRAKALAHKAGAAQADFYPDVNIMGLAGLQSVAWAKLFETTSGTGVIRPAISLPIFTAGAIRANVRAKKSAFDAAIADYNKLVLQSTQEVLDVLAFASSVYQQKKEQVTIINAAEQRYKLTKLREKHGLDSQFDTYYLQEDVIQKKLTDIVLLYNQYVASVKLVKSLGGGYCQLIVPLTHEKKLPVATNQQHL